LRVTFFDKNVEGKDYVVSGDPGAVIEGGLRAQLENDSALV